MTQSGNVTGQGEGTAIIYAAAGGFRDSAFITVYPDTGWIIQVSNATEDLYGVFFQPDGRSGWAVGSGGLILRTTDAGVNWTRTIVAGGYDMPEAEIDYHLSPVVAPPAPAVEAR